MWWHLAVGEALWHQRTVFFPDPLSFTHPVVWVNAQWLAELLLAAVHSLVGIVGLEVFALFLKVAAFLLVFAAIPAPSLTKIWVTILFAFGALPVMGGVRPQLFSFLFLASLSLWLHRQRRAVALHPEPTLMPSSARSTPFFALPLLFALWANTHSFYPLALVLLVLAVVADWLNERWGWAPTLGGEWRRRMSITLGFCAIAVVLTPFGWHAPKQVLVNIVQSSQLPIEEWKPVLAMRHPLIILWTGLLLLWLFCLAWSPKRPEALELLWGSFATFNALAGVRMIAPWCLLMAPFVGAHIAAWLLKYSSTQAPRWMAPSIAVLCAAMVGFLFVWKFSPAEFAKRESKEYPQKAVAWLKQQGWQGHCFTRYDWGGYVAWQLRGQVRVFVDGRADFYPAKVMRDFITAYFGGAQWQRVLDRYGVQLVLVPPNAPLANLLALRPQSWQRLYRDSKAVIFVRRTNQKASGQSQPAKPQKGAAQRESPKPPIATKR